MDRRYIAVRDRNRERKWSAIEEWNEIYSSLESTKQKCLDDWVTAIVARAHKLGAKNYGSDAAKETIIAFLHWENEQSCEKKRQKALGRLS